MSVITLTKKSETVYDASGNAVMMNKKVYFGYGDDEKKFMLTRNDDNKLCVVVMERNGKHLYDFVLTEDGKYNIGPRYGHFVKPTLVELIKRILKMRGLDNTIVVLLKQEQSAKFFINRGDLQIFTDGKNKFSGIEIEEIGKSTFRKGT